MFSVLVLICDVCDVMCVCVCVLWRTKCCKGERSRSRSRSRKIVLVERNINKKKGQSLTIIYISLFFIFFSNVGKQAKSLRLPSSVAFLFFFSLSYGPWFWSWVVDEWVSGGCGPGGPGWSLVVVVAGRSTGLVWRLQSSPVCTLCRSSKYVQYR